MESNETGKKRLRPWHPGNKIQIRFDGPTGPESGRFVEVNEQGALRDRLVGLLNQDRVAELEAENERLRNAWISVDERLPEHPREYVLGWMPIFPGGRLCSMTVTPSDDLWQYVTHWQPLPKGPSE
jgi:hypothetical protein